MAEIMFEVIAFGFKDVEFFVFDFPAGTAASSGFGDVMGSDRKIGYETVVIGDLAAVGAADFDVEPVDVEGILAVAQRHVMEPAIAIDETGFAALVGFLI